MNGHIRDSVNFLINDYIPSSGGLSEGFLMVAPFP